MNETSSKVGWFEHISTLLSRKPEDRDQLLALLHSAYERNLLEADALAMIEGVMQVSEMQVRDVMIPRSQMDTIDINEKPEEFIPVVIETAHSRFPVIEGSKDQIIGILLAKDLLRYYASKGEFNIRDMLRPVVYIPESKRLNILLKDFRSNRNHMAIVVDEYGGVAGLVTIEDVLEQIVGDIEDEYDFDEEDAYIVADTDGHYRVKSITEISSFNETLGATLSDKEFDTIGGLVINKFGRLPKNGESIAIEDFNFTAIRADSRRLHLLKVERIKLGEIENSDPRDQV
ncbi:MAG: CBS domain-containing protein [Nitrosomonas sp.]|uniref:HlyC/CorC family transporter n=1 Tax=Nitrosomonas sp. TaxID=42353 RepID=UPI002565353F|nr:transporter associated domain-containing protein [Nitrosomonas sp.]MCC6160623.1 CBS domain-containing protein [Nitrosomonas sp.]MDL1866897.1 CBS domain-containing protein [Betaproteobacteria bacterium PRO4]